MKKISKALDFVIIIRSKKRERGGSLLVPFGIGFPNLFAAVDMDRLL